MNVKCQVHVSRALYTECGYIQVLWSPYTPRFMFMLIGLIPRRAANGTAAATFTAIVWGVSWIVEADKYDEEGNDGDDDDGDDDDDDDRETAADEVGNEDDEEEEEEDDEEEEEGVTEEAEVEEKSVNEPRFGVEGSISVPSPLPPPLPSPVSPPMLLVALLALLTLPRLNKSRRNVFPKSPASNPCSNKKER